MASDALMMHLVPCPGMETENKTHTPKARTSLMSSQIYLDAISFFSWEMATNSNHYEKPSKEQLCFLLLGPTPTALFVPTGKCVWPGSTTGKTPPASMS